jgi:hypothetical protein
MPVPMVLVLDDLPGHLAIIPDKFPAVLLKHFIADKFPGCWVRILKKVPVPKFLVMDNLPGL